MRWTLATAIMALTACGGPAPDPYDDSYFCNGADLVIDFAEGPGQLGRACVFWSNGRNETIRLRLEADGRWTLQEDPSKSSR